MWRRKGRYREQALCDDVQVAWEALALLSANHHSRTKLRHHFSRQISARFQMNPCDTFNTSNTSAAKEATTFSHPLLS